MSSPDTHTRIETFLKKSLLGQDLVDTQFHLFSARSTSGRAPRVFKPRVLCANNVLLAKSSAYFLDLLGSDVDASDASLIDLGGDDDVPGDEPIKAYGYESDSDLDECDDCVPATSSKTRKDKDKDKDKWGHEASDDGSDLFAMSPEQPSAVIKGGAASVVRSDIAIRSAASDDTSKHQKTAMRLRSLTSRHVLVKDTAFQTWYTLLYYLYTDKVEFLPLSSTTPGRRSKGTSSTGSLDEPRCSAKSMYRLASKVGLDHLRNEAFSYIQNNLTEQNILRELSSSLLSTHPQLREMELDVLYAHIGSPAVVAGFSAFARRIASGEMRHGAEVVVGIHTRLLKASGSGSVLAVRGPLGAVGGEGGEVGVGVKRPEVVEGQGRSSGANAPSSCADSRVPVMASSGTASGGGPASTSAGPCPGPSSALGASLLGVSSSAGSSGPRTTRPPPTLPFGSVQSGVNVASADRGSFGR